MPFEITADEAVARFERYQQQSLRYLHAPSLLQLPAGAPADPTSLKDGGQAPSITAAYLPFWAFDVSHSAEARGRLGFKDAK